MLSNLAPDIYATINLKEIQFEFQLNTIASSQSSPSRSFVLVLFFYFPLVIWVPVSSGNTFFLKGRI